MVSYIPVALQPPHQPSATVRINGARCLIVDIGTRVALFDLIVEAKIPGRTHCSTEMEMLAEDTAKDLGLDRDVLLDRFYNRADVQALGYERMEE